MKRWLLVLTFASLQAQPLTLPECIRKALAVPSAVSVARLDRAIADKDAAIARAGYLPQAAATIGGVYTSPSNNGGFSFIPQNAVREYIGLAHIFQEIDTSGRIRSELARARANQAIAQAGTGIAERDLKRAVSAAYIRLLLTRRLITAIESSLAESASFEARVKKLFDGGEAARADVVKAAAQVSILKQTLTQTNLAAQLANQDLASFWTTDTDAKLDIEDTFDQALPADETQQPNFLKRLEFTSLDAQKQGLQADARRAKSFLFPTLNFSFNYGLDAERVEWQRRGFSLMGTLNVPIFDWFRALNTARQFTARAEQVTQTRAITERRLSQELSNAQARLQSIREQLAQSKEQIALAEEDFKLSRIRYEGGEGAAVDVVVAQGQLVQARSNYYSNIANYLNAKLDLEVAAGR